MPSLDDGSSRRPRLSVLPFVVACAALGAVSSACGGRVAADADPAPTRADAGPSIVAPPAHLIDAGGAADVGARSLRDADPGLGFPSGAVATDLGGYNSGGVAIYPPNPTHGAAPLAVLGASWEADNCNGIIAVAFDGAHRVYALCTPIFRSADQSPTMVAVFENGASANSAPIRVIAAQRTDTYYQGIAVEPDGEIDLTSVTVGARFGPSYVERYPSGGGQPFTLVSASTDCFDGITSDRHGGLLVASIGLAPVFTYTVDAAGVHPSGTFGAPADLAVPRAVAVDAAGRVYAAGDLTSDGTGGGAVAVYGTTGALETIITGSATGLGALEGAAIGPDGRLYVVDQTMLRIFPVGAKGNAVPDEVIVGATTTVAIAP